ADGTLNEAAIFLM
ncbi:hypothetical protein EUTSA_v100150340mg, partial [Eutrema salsugineum]